VSFCLSPPLHLRCEFAYPSGDETTSILCDFYNTGEFTSLVVPEGCTWESGSGAFLPEPATLGLLAAGGLALLRRRRGA